MQIISQLNDPILKNTLNSGGIAVLRTDTLYGLVALADNHSAVEKVYQAKKRDPNKSCIVLIDRLESSYATDKNLANSSLSVSNDRPTSWLIPSEQAPDHLLRANNLLAYRIPQSDDLRQLITQVGPIIAPSANPEGQAPARTIDSAIVYFGELVDVYVDGGVVPADTAPSRIMKLHPNGRIEQLRS